MNLLKEILAVLKCRTIFFSACIGNILKPTHVQWIDFFLKLELFVSRCQLICEKISYMHIYLVIFRLMESLFKGLSIVFC